MRWLSQRTPTVDADRVYAFTARGELQAGEADLTRSRPSVYLSEISFAFYMLHGIVFPRVGALLPQSLGAYPRGALMIAATGLIAAVVYRGLEVPLRG